MYNTELEFPNLRQTGVLLLENQKENPKLRIPGIRSNISACVCFDHSNILGIIVFNYFSKNIAQYHFSVVAQIKVEKSNERKKQKISEYIFFITFITILTAIVPLPIVRSSMNNCFLQDKSPPMYS